MSKNNFDYFLNDALDFSIPQSKPRKCLDKIGDSVRVKNIDGHYKTGTVVGIWDYFAEVKFHGISGDYIICYPIIAGRIRD